MTTLIKTDIEIATHVALAGGTEKDALRLRRRSVPLTRNKSSMSYLSARSDTDTVAASDVRFCQRLNIFVTFISRFRNSNKRRSLSFCFSS